jgi:hypothetical protein
MGVAGDVPGALQAVDQTGRAARGQLQQPAELAGRQLAGAREVLDGQDLAVGQPQAPGERSALSRVRECRPAREAGPLACVR